MHTDIQQQGRAQLLCWSANSFEQLEWTVKAFLDADPQQRFALTDIAFTLQQGRRELPVRWSQRLRPGEMLALDRMPMSPVKAGRPDLIWVFAGQGSQFSGMLAGLYQQCGIVRKRVDRCCDHLQHGAGIDLKPLLLQASEAHDEQLQRTELAQPALFILAMAQVTLWQRLGLQAASVFGHSLGEYCAAWMAGVWSLETAVELIHRRGELMAGAAPGAMLACQASVEQLQQLPAAIVEQLDIAAINSPSQTVISVALPALTVVTQGLESAAIRFTQLPTSHGFHSRMMEPLLDDFRQLIKASSPQTPSFPWFSNLSGELITEAEAVDADYWCRHLRQPVQFKRCVEQAVADSATPLMLEIGPGQNMGSLLAASCDAVVSTSRGRNSSNHYDDWLDTLGELWQQGVAIDWTGFQFQSRPGRVPLPGTALKPVRCWADTDNQAGEQAASRETETESAAGDQLSVRQRLQAVWCKVLGIAEIADESNFFALGGNSMHMLEMTRLANSQGLIFSIAQAYEHPDFNRLCTLIETSLADDNVNANADPEPLLPEPYHFSQLTDTELELISRSSGGQKSSVNQLIEDAVGLSAMQAGMLSQCQCQPDQPLYVEQMILQLDGPLHLNHYRSAWLQLQRAHPALRTSIHSEGLQHPHQVIWCEEACSLPLTIHDWQDEEEFHLRLKSFSEQERRQGFDLTRAPLYRVHLIQTAPRQHVMLLTISHLIIDGWSFTVLFQELADCYFGLLTDKPLALPPAAGISAFLAWQQRQNPEHQIGFWQQRLRDAAPGSAPADSWPVAQPDDGEPLVVLPWSALQYSQLETGCRRLSVTQNACFQAACAIALSRWLQQDDVVVGTTLANRAADIPGVARILGPLLNTIPLRWQFDWSVPCDEFLQQYHRQLAETLQQGTLPLAQILEQTDWSASEAPFEVLTVFQNTPGSKTAEADDPEMLRAKLLQAQESVGYPIAIYCIPDENLELQLRYDSRRWNPALMEALLQTIRHLMLQLVTVDLPLRRLAGTPNPSVLQGPVVRGESVSIPARLEQLARQQPGSNAMSSTGRPTLSYSALWQQVRQMAAALEQQGIAPGTAVGCHLPHGEAAFICLLAVLSSGGCYLPLDPAYPEARLQAMVADSDCGLVITNDREAAQAIAGRCPVVDWRIPATDGLPGKVPQPDSDQPAYMIYTSGTTGAPKASVNSHGGLSNLLECCRQWLDGRQVPPRIYQFAAMNFDASILELCLMLGSGGCLVFGNTESGNRPDLLEQELADSRANLVMLPPVMLPLMRPDKLPELDTVMTGGDYCPADEAVRWSGKRLFFNLYGPSEASVLCLANPVHQTRRSDSLGRLIINSQALLMDQCGQPLPTGVPGELWIGGVPVSLGYHNRDDLNREQFVSVAGERYYRSGDRCVCDADGYLRILGRLDRQVKIRGVRLEPADVEQVLRGCSGVSDAVVLVRYRNEQAIGVDACVTVQSGYQLSASSLRQQIRRHLPGAAIPQRIQLLSRWPMTSNGKIDRARLEQSLAEQSPDETQGVLNPLERRVAGLLADVLGQPVHSLEASFFDLGGSSLQVAQFINRFETTFDLRLPLDLFYQMDRLQTLVEWIELTGQGNSIALQNLLPVMDLATEAVLAPDIRPHGSDLSSPERENDERGWLLTGATGFVGAHLCSTILRQQPSPVYCLVRAETPQLGLERIQRQLQRLSLWRPAYGERIRVLCGDLAEPGLALDDTRWHSLQRQVDHVVHCGAWVNFSYGYGLMKAANVEATEALLRFVASTPGCSMDYISTMSVMAALSAEPNAGTPAERLPLDNWQALAGGYNQSKWVAEQLCHQARARGLDVSIYRLASITGDLTTGICNYEDLIWRIADACRSLKAWPQSSVLADLTPADEVAQLIVTLRQRGVREPVILLTNPNTERWDTLYAAVNDDSRCWQSLPPGQWRQRLLDWLAQYPDSALTSLMPFVSGEEGAFTTPSWNCSETARCLDEQELGFSPVNPAMLATYLASMPDAQPN